MQNTSLQHKEASVFILPFYVLLKPQTNSLIIINTVNTVYIFLFICCHETLLKQGWTQGTTNQSVFWAQTPAASVLTQLQLCYNSQIHFFFFLTKLHLIFMTVSCMQ